MEFTREEISEIIEEAVNRCAKEHKCRLTTDERAMVHSAYESMIEEKANHGTIRVLFQWGVNLTDVTKQVRKWVLIILGLIVLIIGYRIVK